MNKILKWTVLVIGLGLLIYVGFWIYTIVSFVGVFETDYSKTDLIDNYNTKTKEILELKNYIKTIVPLNKTVDIEFDDNKTLGIFHITVNGNNYNNWDIKIGSSKSDTLLQKLGWTNETLDTLKEKLDNANCISIESGEPCTIGYQRSGMGKYLYKVFTHTLNDSLINEYNDGCTYIYYKNNVVLEYGGGAIGPQCFESFKRGRQ